MCQSELTEFFAELTEFAAELSEFSPPKQYSRNSIPPVSYLGQISTYAEKSGQNPALGLLAKILHVGKKLCFFTGK